ncbi:MAG: ATP-binding cassette domain-containing protein, partial [Phycisphaerae bacterium]|nr:ATP-binding cassette domain-containing protein [Phycisphaerae bacterium]
MIQPADKPTPVIKVVDLAKSFGDTQVLCGVNLEVYPGETMVIMGGSGCGKSTLLRHMIGSLTPDTGRVELFAQDICSLPERQLDEIRKRF